MDNFIWNNKIIVGLNTFLFYSSNSFLIRNDNLTLFKKRCTRHDNRNALM